MLTINPLDSRDAANRFARENLQECAVEILEMKATGVLRDGKVRQLAEICACFVGTASAALSVAEAIVNAAALQAAADGAA
jgi:hypothetical protein